MRPTIGTVEEIAGFLARFPPYDTLGRDDLLRIAAAVTLRSYPAGTDILIEDGPRRRGFSSSGAARPNCAIKTRW
jgi:signal-transduction protein with cAMP-binding, CBS, and nucleotidyltransferase domain